MSNKLKNWQIANKVYSTLMDLDSNTAITELNNLQGIDAEIKEIVTGLIESGNITNDVLQKEIIQFPKAGSNLSGENKTGKDIENYKLIKEIGKGGMSKVYKALRINAENQKPVAIKVFASSGSNKKLLDHFFSEQKILSNLTHPNIITMHHGGTTSDGTSYLVMELLENSQDLDVFVKKKKLSIKSIIELVITSANAIAYAHGQLVIHRDIKPSNIIINENGDLKVVDFGIAKLMSKDKIPDKNTIMALTPSYASPEQINSENISTQTDVFSLAVVAIKLITGKVPFANDRIIKSCVNDEDQVNKALKDKYFDKDLKNILNKALKPNPEQRYNSMQQFADDLVCWLKQEPVSATPDSFFYHVNKFAKRRRALFASLITLFITLSLGVVILSWQYQKIKIEAQKAEHVKNFMLDSFEFTDPHLLEGEEVSARDILETAALKLNNSNLDDAIRFDLLQSIGIAFGKIGQYNSSIEFLKTSLKINPNNSKSNSYLVQYLHLSDKVVELNKVLETIDPETYESYEDKSRIMRVMANNLSNNGDFNHAKEIIAKLSTQNVTDNNYLDYILNQSTLAGILLSESKSEEAVQILETILKGTKLKNTHTTMLELRIQLIDALYNSAYFEKAFLEINNLLKLQKKIYNEEHPTIAYSYYQLASTLRKLGKLDKSEEAINQSLIIRKKIFGDDNIKVAHSLHFKSILLSDKGELDESINLTSKVIEIFTRVKGADHHETLILGSNLAAVLNRNNRSEEALEHVTNIYRINVNKLGEAHHESLYTRKILANTLSKLKRHQQAIEEIEDAVNIAKSNFKINHPIVPSLVYNQAMIYRANSQLQKALETYNEIIENNMIEDSNLLYGITLKRLALINEEMNNNDDAHKYFNQSLSVYAKNYGIDGFNTIDLQLLYINYLIKQENYIEAMKLIAISEKNIDDTNKKHSGFKQKIIQLTNEIKNK